MKSISLPRRLSSSRVAMALATATESTSWNRVGARLPKVIAVEANGVPPGDMASDEFHCITLESKGMLGREYLGSAANRALHDKVVLSGTRQFPHVHPAFFGHRQVHGKNDRGCAGKMSHYRDTHLLDGNILENGGDILDQIRRRCHTAQRSLGLGESLSYPQIVGRSNKMFRPVPP